MCPFLPLSGQDTAAQLRLIKRFFHVFDLLIEGLDGVLEVPHLMSLSDFLAEQEIFLTLLLGDHLFETEQLMFVAFHFLL